MQEKIPLGNLADIFTNAAKMYVALAKDTIDCALTLGIYSTAEDTAKDYGSLRKTKMGLIGAIIGGTGLIATIGLFAYGTLDLLAARDESLIQRPRIEVYDGNGKPILAIHNPSQEQIEFYRTNMSRPNTNLELEVK